MAIVNTKAVFESDINTVWKRVTSLTEYAWRSDISRIEILNDKQFVEYTKNGYATTFTITAAQPYKRWEFDMENENMKGLDRRFTQIANRSKLILRDVTAKKP